jgi:hypothetical protein
MIRPDVGQTWEIEVPKNGQWVGKTALPAKPGEKFRVEILAVDVLTFTCTVATPGMAWTERVSFEFLSDAGTLVQK